MKISIRHDDPLRAFLPLAAAALLSGCLSQFPAPFGDAGSGARTAAPATTAQTDPRFHVVQRGDTLLAISRTYNQNVNDLVRWNGLENPHQIQVGQRLRVVRPDGDAPSAVAVARPIETPGVETVAGVPDEALPPLVDSPRGGRTPYSGEAWAAISPYPLPTEPPLPIPSPPAATQPPAVSPEVRPEPAPPPIATPAPKPEVPESPWIWPASGPVIQGFDEATNKGIDIAGNPGDPVIASAAGNVVYSGSGLRGYGKLVIIKHDDDYLTAYAHNQALLVKEGDEVRKGQKIAELGSTDADRPMLHFEIRKQGRPVDPAQFLPAR